MTIAAQQDHTYQFFQPLSKEEREALKRDIEDRGIQVPIDIDCDGKILDGHHRWEIAHELGWTEERIPIGFEKNSDAFQYLVAQLEHNRSDVGNEG